MFPYDPEILAAASAPAPEVADVLRAMRTIDGLCADTDGLKWFNLLYLQVTAAVKARIEGDGFHDPSWLARLDVEFAALYFSALRSALSGGAAPECWRVLLDRRGDAPVARIQFALAGINAHINHDLPFAIVNACRAAGLAPSHALPQYADYSQVNSTLDALVETAKREFALRLPGDALPAVSHLEETIAAFSVAAAREAAWNQAEILWAIRCFPALSARAADTLDGLTALAGRTLLVPAAP